MLDIENENKATLQRAFEEQLKCAADAVQVGRSVFEALKNRFDDESERTDARTGTVVLLLCTQMMRRCRASVLVWEHGYTAESEVLTRSLFETHLATRFVIEPKLPQPHWSQQLRAEFNTLCSLSGDAISQFTDINFRALLYAAAQTLKRDSKTEKIKALRGLVGVLPDDFGVKMKEAAIEAETELGPQWSDRIRKTGTFHGFSQVRLLAEYCGQDKVAYYQSLYGMHSESTHGEAGLALLNTPSMSMLNQSLCLPCAMLGESYEDFNRVFALGMSVQLQGLADRIRRAFRVD